MFAELMKRNVKNMSEKKYYWLKLQDNFFDDDTIQFIEEQEKWYSI